jgi:RNA recognition motif-containing protein
LTKKNSGCVTLFVGNIPEAVQETEVRKLFERINLTPISVNMRRGGGGRGSGSQFAHVRFVSTDDCIKASTLAGAFLKGNRLRIDWAAEKTSSNFPPPPLPSVAAVGPSSGEDGNRMRTSRVFIGNLTDDMTDADVLPVFQVFGRISSFRNFKDKHGARYAYLTFDEVKAAETAVEELKHTNLTIRGQSIRVDFARQDRPAQEVGPQSSTVINKRIRSPSPPRPTRVTYQVPKEYDEPPWEVFYPLHI